MTRLILVTIMVAGTIGGWYAYTNYALEVHKGPDGTVQYLKIVPRPQDPSSPGGAAQFTEGATRPAIRVATFNLDGLDETKLANRQVGDVLVRLVPRFDIVAVQGVRSKNRGVLVRLVEQINATGACYEFVNCPSVERDGLEQYNAFLFNTASMDSDRASVQSVQGTAGRFACRPVTASFRVRGPAASEAFTFTLINVQTDPRHAAQELDLLADVFRAVRDSGRGEDDVILLGDLQSDSTHLGRLGHVANLAAVINSGATTTRGGRMLDNILIDRRATVEFNGHFGVMDLIRDFDLDQAAALEVSEHLPVWAEFSAYEGGKK